MAVTRLSINTKQTHPQTHKHTEWVFLESDGKKTPCIAAILKERKVSEMFYSRDVLFNIAIKGEKARQLNLKAVFIFYIFNTSICRACQRSAAKSCSVITTGATRTTEDLRVGAVMGRVYVGLPMCMSKSLCTSSCLCSEADSL